MLRIPARRAVKQHMIEQRKWVEKMIEQHREAPKSCEGVDQPVSWALAQEFAHDDMLHELLSCIPRKMEEMGMPPKLKGRALGSGAFGAVYTMADIYTVKVGKVNRDEDDDEFLKLYEYMVGEQRREFVLGLLVNQVPSPNFVKTYALLEMPKRGYTYPTVIQERAPGQTLKALARSPKGIKDEDFLGIWLQVFYSLLLANETLGKYSHNDLHLSNIMVSKMSKPKQFIYPLKKGTRIVTSRMMVKIIDFGKSTIPISPRSSFNIGLDPEDEHVPFYLSDGSEIMVRYPAGYPFDKFVMDLTRLSSLSNRLGDPDYLRIVLHGLPWINQEIGDQKWADNTIWQKPKYNKLVSTWNPYAYQKTMEQNLEEQGYHLVSDKESPDLIAASCDPAVLKKVPKAPKSCAGPTPKTKKMVTWA